MMLKRQGIEAVSKTPCLSFILSIVYLSRKPVVKRLQGERVIDHYQRHHLDS